MQRIKFRSVVALANRKLPIKVAAIVLASSTLISALLGIFRDRLLNSLYLDTYPTGIDAYTAAFVVPDFMFFILTSGALAVSFIPVFNQRLAAGNKRSAWELSSSVINLMAITTFIASILIMIFARPLVKYIVGPGLDESGTILAVNMMRMIAINPLIFAVATVFSSIQQAVGRFVFYALAPAIYNLGILIGILFFTQGVEIFGWKIFEGGIMGVALGVVLGALLQLIVSILGLVGLGFDYSFKIYWKNQGFRSVMRLLPARSIDQGIDYINALATTNLSSRMGAGALRSYQQASTLHQMPISLVGIAISTAFFPKLTEEAKSKEQYNETFRQALKFIIWLAAPISIIAFFARGYVASFIKNGGSSLISAIFASLIIAVFMRSVFHIASRGFYAKQDTKTPLFVSIISIGFTILLSAWFSLILGWGPEGLGLAQSIGAILEVCILLFLLEKQSNWTLLDRKFIADVAKILFSTFIAGCIAYSTVKFFPLLASDNSFFAIFPKFCLIVATSSLSYLIAGYFLDIEETKPIIKFIKRILFQNA